jgi:hypothetical protein
MTDVLKLLPPLKWRGVQYPVVARSVSFAHEKVQHPIQYKDGQLIEQTGAQNLVFSYGIPMREDIAKGPYAHLFRDGLSTLFRDCRDREPGELQDPIYGIWTCVLATYGDETDVNKRDGTDIRIELMHSPELDEENLGTFASLGGLSTDAGLLNGQLTTVDWEQEPSPEALIDPLSAVAGLASQIERQGNKLSAALDDLAFRAEKVERAVDRVENPQMWPMKRSARRVREAAIRAKERATEDPTRRVIRVTQNYQTTLSACAAENGMSLQDFLKLNKQLATKPFVPAGTIINRYG